MAIKIITLETEKAKLDARAINISTPPSNSTAGWKKESKAEVHIAKVIPISKGISKQKGVKKKFESSPIEPFSANDFHSIINGCVGNFSIVTDDIIINYLSSSVWEITGLNSDELFGESFLDLILEDDRSILTAFFLNFSSNFPREIDFRIKHTKGEVKWARGKFLLKNTNKSTRTFIGTIIDISREKLAEKTLLEQAEQLRKVNHELDRFVYSTSHDLRSPLTSTLGLINLMQQEFKDNGLKSYLQLAEKSVVKLDQIIRNILDYSKNSRLDASIKKINCDSLIEKAFREQYNIAGLSEVRKSIKIKEDVPLYSDQHRLDIIIKNLISNAIQYRTLDSTPIIDIELEVAPTHLKFVITDNGIGIQRQFHAKVFEMFFRASERSNGAGLGLYITKESVAHMNGSICMKSEQHKGTSITVIVPNLHSKSHS